MIRRIDLRDVPTRAGPAAYRRLLPRAELDVDAAVELVRPLCEDVRHRGVPALLAAVARFDGVERDSIRVPPAELTRALGALDPGVRAAFEDSIDRLRRVSAAEREVDTTVEVGPGARVTQRLVPFERVGVYVPGGANTLPSSVAMTVVPAQVAGVESIALASPPQPDAGGQPHPTILAVAALLGIEEVYAVGGAAAIAMFAYGADGPEGSDPAGMDGCAPVDFVAGPGRITTVAAKRLVKSVVGVDSEAGPTEIAVLADDTADPAFVAADLISQAEHEAMAASILVTPSERLADAVEGELAAQVPAAKHAGRIAEALGAVQSAVVLVTDLDQGQAVVDAYAAEHLELHTADAAERARSVRHAGAVFVGPWAAVSLGDYCAGSNHVLPTGATARHSSGLSVRSFCRAVHVVEYDRDALRAAADHVVALADAEDLPAHGTAVRVRLR